MLNLLNMIEYIPFLYMFNFNFILIELDNSSVSLTEKENLPFPESTQVSNLKIRK